jgi:adenine-specific DNA-methyltransferase
MAKKITEPKTVETLVHDEAKRKNIPTAEHQSVIKGEDKKPIQIKYPRNTDLDPQILWRGKDEQDDNDLIINAPPLYIQEKVHPKALIDDLLRKTKQEVHDAGNVTADLFADFDGIPKEIDKTEFYSHDQNWSNRMILGDSLQAMASLAEREGLRGQVQCIYFDPPYGIKFNSNFQWSTTSRDVKDGKPDQITREPEQVKAFRDTWRDGIHSYLAYLRDRLTLARDLLSESGSIFVQIGDENIHRVRCVLDEVFGDDNFFSLITVRKTLPLGSSGLGGVSDYILWYAKDKDKIKYRQLFTSKGDEPDSPYSSVMKKDGQIRKATRTEIESPSTLAPDETIFRLNKVTSSGFTASCYYKFPFQGEEISPQKKSWSTNYEGMLRLIRANRISKSKTSTVPSYIRMLSDFTVKPIHNLWSEFQGARDLIYVVQTNRAVVQRCVLMATDPGDLVLDPTCGSGTTAYVAEQWGRRWITIDTSRVALALARARIMGGSFPYYLLSDSREGQNKISQLSGSPLSSQATYGNIKSGFVYERVPHITLKSIATNLEIDVIYEKYSAEMDILLSQINRTLGVAWEEWTIPRLSQRDWPSDIIDKHNDWWKKKADRQIEIDKSISQKGEYENLYDSPYEDKKKVRVAGPFTVESLSPHRTLDVDENDQIIDPIKKLGSEHVGKQSFPQMILDSLRSSGVQQAHKEDKINFISIFPWPGNLVCAEGRYIEGEVEKRSAIFIGSEFGTVQRADLVEAAREAGDAGFDSLIACAFNYEAHATEFNNLGRIPVLKARMNADLHMSAELKNTGKGNLFVIFGEPDIRIIDDVDDQIKVKVFGVDVFKPQTGEVVSDSTDGIACWFIDTDYNEESFFVRQAYFLGANDPYDSLRNSLKSEINEETWATLNSDVSRAFPKPKSGRIAIKVINHLGDEVMKVFKV